MHSMTVAEINRAVAGKIIRGNKDKVVTGVSIDSRTINNNEIFFAIIGEKLDGHKFVKDAVKNGAAAVVVHKDIERYNIDLKQNTDSNQGNSIKTVSAENIAVIKVEDTTKALQQLAAYYRRQLDQIKIIAITGSAGKTSTKDMTAGLLSQQYHVAKTEGNLNNYYGLPLTILNLSDEEIAVLEMGMSRIGEIKLLTDIARPDIGIITNVAATHLETLGSVDNVARGKSELIKGLAAGTTAILNYDNKYVKKMNQVFKGKNIIYYGLSEKADIYADNIKINSTTSFNLNYQGDSKDILLNKPGEHNIYNSLAAVAVAREFGVSWDKIAAALENIEFSALRWDVRNLGNNVKVINDTYNANPLSMRAAVNTAVNMAKKRLIVVLGAMLELGDREEEEHKNLGEFISNNNINILMTVGETASLIAKAAVSNGMNSKNVYCFDNNTDIAEKLKDILKDNDTILVKGSRGNRMEEIVEDIL
ncbi:MAG: UDP-N-acetylmuramoyl-tripeptide--D-alanyl-D-alanine ligase [Halothermotrichaceae bacterium]